MDNLTQHSNYCTQWVFTFIFHCRKFKGKNAFVGVFKNRTPELMILDSPLVIEILVGKFKHFNTNFTNVRSSIYEFGLGVWLKLKRLKIFFFSKNSTISRMHDCLNETHFYWRTKNGKKIELIYHQRSQQRRYICTLFNHFQFYFTLIKCQWNIFR